MTGDNQYVTQKIARDVELAADRIFIGDQVDEMDDAALAYQAENGAIFARVSPEQRTGDPRLESARARRRIYWRWHQRCSITAHRGCRDFLY